MEAQRERARSAAKFDDSFNSDEGWVIFDPGKTTEFLGYEKLGCECKILRYREDGDKIFVITDQTPFYAESVGQAGDQGVLSADQVSLNVDDVKKVLDLGYIAAASKVDW